MEYTLDYILLGKRIKTRRLALHLTQEHLAESAAVGIQHLSKIENGKTKLSLPRLLDIANALQTTVDSLLVDSVEVLRPNITYADEGMFSDCTPAEIYVLTQTVNTLKRSLREHNLTNK
jgi:transcriptional regulator with XRE-family HTH domain